MSKKSQTAAPAATAETSANGVPAKAPKCPLSRKQFQEAAQAVIVKIGESQVVAAPKQFSTGSFGWFSNDKIALHVGGHLLKVQCNILLTVVGSKEVTE